MKKRILSLVLAAGMLISTLVGCGSGTASNNSSAADTSAQRTGSDAVTKAAEELLGHSDTNGKEETVYVIGNADGATDQVIVSEWLKNKGGAKTLQDQSHLSDIKNVKGNENYTKGSDGKLTWNADGNDIYYQGTSKAPLPVNVTITYKLDGKKVTAKELDGASGKLTIQFDYKNNTGEQKKVNGKNVTIYQPFMMVSGLLLDNDKASDVEVTNGKVINSGDKTVVVGMAMPGLEESLGLNKLKDNDGKSININIPDQVKITANVKNFSLLTTVTLAENTALEELKLDDVNSVGDLKDSLKDLGDASDKLVDGSKKLADGMSTLGNKSGDLASGAKTVDDSTKKIAKGSDTLTSGASKVNDGAKAANSGANQVKNGASKVSNAAGKVKNGSSTLAGGLNVLADSVSGLPDASKQLLGGAKSIKTALGSKGSSGNTIYAGAAAIAAGADQMSSSLKNSNGTSVYEAGMGIQSGAMLIKSGAQGISNGLQVAAQNLKTSEGYVNNAISQLEQLSKADGVSKETLATYQAIIAELQGSLKYQDGVYDGLTSTKGDKTLQGGLSTIEKGAEQLADYGGKVASGAESLDAGAKKIAAGASAIENGIDTMVSGNGGSNLQTMIDGLSKLNKESGELVSGTQKLADGAGTLADGTSQLADGTDTLAHGANSLADGTNKLSNGTSSLADGASSLSNYLGQLSDGTGKLSEGASKLIDGIGKLVDGSDDLATGMAKFDKEGIRKITDLMDGDLTGVVDRLEAVQDYAKEYDSYGGCLKHMDSTTKFIYKTDSIGDTSVGDN